MAGAGLTCQSFAGGQRPLLCCSPYLGTARFAAVPGHRQRRLHTDSLDGTQCPANELVITPSAPIRNGGTFTVTVNYTGRPGVHNDGDGTHGPARFDAALRQLQRAYGGSSISEPELEAVFHHWLPVHSSACQQRLSQFFSQWFDIAYPAGGGANRPMITGPGLAGPGFYSADGMCA